MGRKFWICLLCLVVLSPKSLLFSNKRQKDSRSQWQGSGELGGAEVYVMLEKKSFSGVLLNGKI